jgi:hypothetical protein
MTTALHGWLNIPVKITLQSIRSEELHGTLFHIDEAGILLENRRGKLFIPFAAILHIEPCDAPDPESELAAQEVTVAEIQFWRPHD